MKSWTFLDRSEWGSGEWDSEPDKVQWTDEATGYACLLHRGGFGHWCGYVGVPPSHPMYAREYSDIYENVVVLDVHGGLTFSDHCDPLHDEETGRGICHVPEPGSPDDVWWLGFDCGHAFDYSPGAAARLKAFAPELPRLTHEIYRNMAYVMQQTRELAAQLAELA
ncbi:hypothetical protein BGV56_00830 [Burkholderia ubonensis]|uniref:hypothetical protein n=1 Tax=Burkholderia ubonensis TaxID=101571 RepID=UPI00075BA1A5|nr:hypothetical protein [Burkholderia ubonensis]KVT60618.1 hypothetical protein WK55_09745 [Burkholderia ubonensis]OJB40371.1 hypothetical protein BGV56_00830 [Burkholderia ubonensis]